MKVLDVVALSEYIGCDVFDQLGNKIEITKENCSEVYDKDVESLAAAGDKIKIYTFDEIDNPDAHKPIDNDLWVDCNDPIMEETITAALMSVKEALDICYWKRYQEEMDSPFSNTGNRYSNDYFTVRAYSWADEDDEEPNFETEHIRVWWYKWMGKSMKIQFKYGWESYKTVALMLYRCRESIRKDFGNRY